MRKFVTAMCLAAGLTAIPALATAAPIGINGCTGGVCDIYADYDGTGASSLGALEGNLGDYLIGYTILLNLTADLSDGFQASDVAHILVIHDSVFELFSNTVFNDLFDGIFTAATMLDPTIDGLSVTIGQLAGCPAEPDGVPNVGLVGYCTTADVVSLGVNWGVGADGGFDLLNIHTALPVVDPPPTDPVPEPGTLALIALGASGALASRRRRRTPNPPAV